MRNLLLLSVVAIVCALLAPAALADDPNAEALQNKRIDIAQARLKEAESVRWRAVEELAKMRHIVRDQTGLVEVNPETIRQVIGKLQEQREQLELDAAGATGRRKGIDEAIAEMSAKTKERASGDGVAAELAKVVEVRETQLKRIQALKAQATVSAEEADIAFANLAKARAELAAVRERTSSVSADLLDSWNRQRLELTISELERSARLQFITKRLDSFSKALGQLDTMEQLRLQLDQADRAMAKAQDDLDAARQRPELRALFEWINKHAGEEAPKKP